MRFITFSVFATLLSAPAFAADLGTYRPGTPYGSTVAAGADVCDNQCAGDAQCRGWNYVKPNPKAAGICEFLSSVSTPIASQISISGESLSAAPISSRVTSGATNTVRVGTQPPSSSNTVRVGQSPSNRRVVRQAPTQRIATQQTSTRSIEDMSLTAQQNRYRQGIAGVPKPTPQPQMQAPVPGQRPMFRPILDAPAPQFSGQQIRQPQAQNATQRQASRRATGPRRVQGQPVPQFQDPRAQIQGQQFQRPQSQQRGHSRPPIGQPIPAAQAPVRAQPTTPSQRLAQMAAQTRTQVAAVPPTGPIALTPQQARKSLYGQLNDDVAPSSSLPTANAVPTQPVVEQPLGEILAGGR
ncbi:MAG: hypothetical protein ABJO36_08535 [Litorimonas sp.]